jgi:protein YibB
MNTTIVTAFFDIGRGTWTGAHLPHFLQRTTDTYMERFSYMASVKNDMVIFTSQDLVERISQIRTNSIGKTTVIPIDLDNLFDNDIKLIQTVQKLPEFIQQVNPDQRPMPEYWSPKYVLVNYLKSWFATAAIKSNLVLTDQLAWVDFGYCRSPNTVHGCSELTKQFDSTKIHMFKFREPNLYNTMQLIQNNIVCIFGAKIIAHVSLWPSMYELINKSFTELISNNLIDDDQTLMFMAHSYRPDLFQLHQIYESNPFVLFQEFCS